MMPIINDTRFGSITISGKRYEHDVIIRLDGQIEKRKKKLSKAIYGSSHMLSLDEAIYIYEPGAKQLIIGAGQVGYVQLSEEAAEYLRKKKCAVQLIDTKQAVNVWNAIEGRAIGLFHVTC